MVRHQLLPEQIGESCIFALRDDVFQKNLLTGTQIEVEIRNITVTMTTTHIFEGFDLIDQQTVLPENDLPRQVIDISIKPQIRSIIGLEREFFLQQRLHIRQISGITDSSIYRHSLGRRHGGIVRAEQGIQDIPPDRIADSMRYAVRGVFKQDFNIVAGHGGVAKQVSATLHGNSIENDPVTLFAPLSLTR